MKEATSTLARYGYKISQEAMESAHNAIGEPLSDSVREWYELTADFLVMAYEAGRPGKTLTEAFPWIVKAADAEQTPRR